MALNPAWCGTLIFYPLKIATQNQVFRVPDKSELAYFHGHLRNQRYGTSYNGRTGLTGSLNYFLEIK